LNAGIAKWLAWATAKRAFIFSNTVVPPSCVGIRVE
jgi:hypothetical protein